MNSHDDSQYDDKLKAFMKSHAPVAPVAPQNELERIERSVGLQQQIRPNLKGRWVTWSGAGALAASFAASWFLLSGPDPASTSVRQASEEWALHVLTGDQDDESVPTNDVGEEYLGLLAGR